MVFPRYCFLSSSFFAILLVFDCKLCADIDCFQLDFVVDIVPRQDANFFSSSVELSESSCRYLIDLKSWFGALAIAFLGHATLGLSVGAAEHLGTSFGVLQVCYFL